jgi:hypothetical protein
MSVLVKSRQAFFLGSADRPRRRLPACAGRLLPARRASPSLARHSFLPPGKGQFCLRGLRPEGAAEGSACRPGGVGWRQGRRPDDLLSVGPRSQGPAPLTVYARGVRHAVLGEPTHLTNGAFAAHPAAQRRFSQAASQPFPPAASLTPWPALPRGGLIPPRNREEEAVRHHHPAATDAHAGCAAARA